MKTIDDETHITVGVGIGKPVELRIRQPPRPEADNPIIIFLRRGIPTPRPNDTCAERLAVGANATVVEIRYRLSLKNGYPSTIHRVVAGYDWVRTNLARGREAFKSSKITTKPSKIPKIGVCGELVGGSLATMLALTECFYTPADLETQGISALAVGNPILDWTALAPPGAIPPIYQTGVVRKVGYFPRAFTDGCLTATGLCAIRDTFFSKAESYFDPFASPLLFFRTPSSEIPNEAPASTEQSLLNGGPEEAKPVFPPAKKRPSGRKYPPTGSQLVFPWTMVEVGRDSVVKDQGMDLIGLMRNSFERLEVQRAADAKNAVKRDFEIEARGGVGLWDEEHTLEIGQWLGIKLREP